MKGKFKIERHFFEVKDDLSKIVDAIVYYDTVIEEARKDMAVIGDLEGMIQTHPGIEEAYNGIHDDCAAIEKFLGFLVDYEESKEYKRLTGKEGRQEYGDLKATDLRNYVNANDDIFENKKLLTTITYYKNRLGTITDALKSKAYSLNSIKEIRLSGATELFVDATKERVQ